MANKNLTQKIEELQRKINSEPQGLEDDIVCLIQENNIEKAEKLVRSNKLSEDWCHKAVAVYVLKNKNELAREVINWAKNNSTKLYVWRLCIYEYAKAQWKKIWGNDPEGFIVLPNLASQKEKDGTKEILEVIQPVLLHIEGDECVSNDIEAKLLFIAINANWLLGDISKVRKLASYLVTKKPASIELAHLAMIGLADKNSLSSDFPDRLKDENPESFIAFMFSHLLRSDLFYCGEEAFASLKRYAPSIKEDQKIKYAEGLLHIAQLLGDAQVEECIKILEELLGKESHFCKLSKAQYLINLGKIQEAESIIQECKDENNPQWLQIHAFIQAEKENFAEAIESYEKAANLIVSPEILATLGRVAIKASKKDNKFTDKIISAYNSLLSLQPDKLAARHNLAFALVRIGRIQEAKFHFEYLAKHSSDPIYQQNYGTCLAQTGEPQKALEIYDEICSRDDASLDSVLAKTELLKVVKDPFSAFDFLNKYRERFWDAPSYLNCYMTVASQANHDGQMHEAFEQLRLLQKKGIIEPGVIQEKNIEDLLAYAKSRNEKARQIYELSTKGQMPWVMADKMLNYSLYQGWYFRTQELRWISEEPITTATYSVYSTNSYHPLMTDDNKIRLERLHAPLFDSEIVLDITSIITLHRLDLIDKARDFFKKIFIPSSYLAGLLKDKEKVAFHQFSQVEATTEIKKYIDSGDIELISDVGQPNARPCPFINEHTIPDKDEEHYYRLIDIISLLENEGLIRQAEAQKIKEIHLNSSGVDQLHPPLKKNDMLLVEASSLKTLFSFGLFPAVLNNFKICLTVDNNSEIISEYTAIDLQKKLQGWSKELYELKDKFAPLDADVNEVAADDYSLASIKLAKKKNLSLFTDDRVVQMASLNEQPRSICFGTDLFLNALYSEGHIDIVTLTNKYLQLMIWRYKFILPPVEILLYLAEQYATRPPGSELRKIAAYLHDCMRDPGLFCGAEKTAEIPLSIAAKTYVELVRIITNFLVQLWDKENINEGSVKKITDWVFLEFLPTTPKYLTDGGYQLANLTKRIVFQNALIQLVAELSGPKYLERGNKVLLLLREKLELSEVEYNRLVSEALNAI